VTYDPTRGGHAPGHLRGWLYQYITNEIDEWDPPGFDLEHLTSLLWNCTDIMPGDVRDAMSEFLLGFGYEGDPIYTVAQACRRLGPSLGRVLAMTT
jgi:hypothetical protein